MDTLTVANFFNMLNKCYSVIVQHFLYIVQYKDLIRAQRKENLVHVYRCKILFINRYRGRCDRALIVILIPGDISRSYHLTIQKKEEVDKVVLCLQCYLHIQLPSVFPLCLTLPEAFIYFFLSLELYKYLPYHSTACQRIEFWLWNATLPLVEGISPLIHFTVRRTDINSSYRIVHWDGVGEI